MAEIVQKAVVRVKQGQTRSPDGWTLPRTLQQLPLMRPLFCDSQPQLWEGANLFQDKQESLERVMSSLAGQCCSAVGCASTAAYSKSEMRLDTPAVAKMAPSRSNSMDDRIAADWRVLARGSCAITCAAGASVWLMLPNPT